MEFLRERVFTSLNADELHEGDMVIVANALGTLKRNVANNVKPLILLEVIDEDYDLRFEVNFNKGRYALAYLVERKENCTNCEGCEYQDKEWMKKNKDYLINRCENYKPKTKKEINMDNWNHLNYFGCSLPEKQEMGVSDRVVVAVRGYNVPDVGYYDYDLEAWFVDGNRYPVPVYAWHYDKPPREE